MPDMFDLAGLLTSPSMGEDLGEGESTVTSY